MTLEIHQSKPKSRTWTVGSAWHRSQRSPTIASIQFILLASLTLWVIIHGANQTGYSWQWYAVPKFIWRNIDGEFIWGPLVRGLWVTIEITLWCAGLALLVGLVTAMLRFSESIAGNFLASAYLQLFRNTPLLVQMYLFYFVISPIIGVDRFWTGVICLAFHEGSFIAEIIRAGIQSVERGQVEASESLGLTRWNTYRYVIFPQAIPLMLPPLTGQLVNLVKNSSIVSVIAIADLTTEGRNVIADTFLSFEIWFTVAAIYLAINISLSVLVTLLEQRVRAK